MNALIFNAPWELEMGEAEEMTPVSPDDVVVDMRAIGICGTDLGIVSGQYPPVRPPVVLGHEAAGIVHAVGEDVTDLVVGERVVIDPTFSCGYCRMCTTGRSNHCLHKDGTECGVSADGMFRRQHRTKRRFLHRFPDSVAFEAAALTEPLSCAMTGVQQLNLRTDYTAAVVGGGPMGLLYAHVLAVHGVRGHLVETSPARRELAEQALPPGWHGAENLAQASASSAVSAGLDVVVETSGAAVGDALDHLERGGQILSVGLGGGSLTLDPSIFADHSKRLVGSIDSLDGSFAAALDLVVNDRVPTDVLASHRFALEDYASAFELLGVDLNARRRLPPGPALKVVLTP